MAKARKAVLSSPDSPIVSRAPAPRADAGLLPLQQVHQLDCVAGMNSLPAGSVDLVFADPPFNIGFKYDVYDDRREREHYLSWSRDWIAAAHRALKPDGTFWLAIGDEYAAELKVLSLELGFHCRSWVVWYYTFGVNCKAKFTRSHAHLFHFVKNPESFTFRFDELENRIPSARQLVYGDGRANPVGRLPDDTWILRPQDMASCLMPQEDTWYFPRVAGTFKERAGYHGCQMPEQLLGRILRVCSHENELVLDPFAGSCSTLVVAKKLGRRFVGFDLSADYVRRGQERLELVRIGDPLVGAAEPTMSAPATPQDLKGRKRAAQVKRLADGQLDAAQQRELAEEIVRERKWRERLVEAYAATSRGHSLDRVLADPDLQAELARRCEQDGLLGEPRVWNSRLLFLRKQGQLAHIPTTERTEVAWEACDGFSYASELAMTQLLSEGFESIDEILCDPPVAARFDALCAAQASGATPLEYRWAAIKLRKDAKLARTRSALLTPGRFSPPCPLQKLDGAAIPETAGVYVVREAGAKRALYVGETFSLRSRLRRQFNFAVASIADFWSQQAPLNRLEVTWFTATARTAELLAYKSLVARQFKSQGNFPELVGAGP